MDIQAFLKFIRVFHYRSGKDKISEKFTTTQNFVLFVDTFETKNYGRML